MESRGNGRGLMRDMVIPVVFVVAGLALGYLIATVLGVTGERALYSR